MLTQLNDYNVDPMTPGQSRLNIVGVLDTGLSYKASLHN